MFEAYPGRRKELPPLQNYNPKQYSQRPLDEKNDSQNPNRMILEYQNEMEVIRRENEDLIRIKEASE